MAGRPSIFTQELAALICSRMADGESLRSICRDEEMPSTATVFRWLAADVPFRDQYTRAMDSRADAFAEEILQIADDDSDDEVRDPETGNTRMNTEFVARSRLKVDTRKWLMARMAPKRYGDKVTQEISGPDGGAIKSEVTEVRLVAVPIPERDENGYPIKKDAT
jgi:hypothetical protein